MGPFYRGFWGVLYSHGPKSFLARVLNGFPLMAHWPFSGSLNPIEFLIKAPQILQVFAFFPPFSPREVIIPALKDISGFSLSISSKLSIVPFKSFRETLSVYS